MFQKVMHHYSSHLYTINEWMNEYSNEINECTEKERIIDGLLTEYVNERNDFYKVWMNYWLFINHQIQQLIPSKWMINERMNEWINRYID